MKAPFGVALIFGAPLAISAARVDNYSKVMVAGAKLEVAGYLSIREDCASMGDAVVRN